MMESDRRIAGMTRRDFISYGAGAGFAVLLGPIIYGRLSTLPDSIPDAKPLPIPTPWPARQEALAQITLLDEVLRKSLNPPFYKDEYASMGNLSDQELREFIKGHSRQVADIKTSWEDIRIGRIPLNVSVYYLAQPSYEVTANIAEVGLLELDRLFKPSIGRNDRLIEMLYAASEDRLIFKVPEGTKWNFKAIPPSNEQVNGISTMIETPAGRTVAYYTVDGEASIKFTPASSIETDITADTGKEPAKTPNLLTSRRIE